jgi:hypothetical protein
MKNVIFLTEETFSKEVCLQHIGKQWSLLFSFWEDRASRRSFRIVGQCRNRRIEPTSSCSKVEDLTHYTATMANGCNCNFFIKFHSILDRTFPNACHPRHFVVGSCRNIKNPSSDLFIEPSLSRHISECDTMLVDLDLSSVQFMSVSSYSPNLCMCWVFRSFEWNKTSSLVFTDIYKI